MPKENTDYLIHLEKSKYVAFIYNFWIYTCEDAFLALVLVLITFFTFFCLFFISISLQILSDNLKSFYLNSLVWYISLNISETEVLKICLLVISYSFMNCVLLIHHFLSTSSSSS